MATIQGGEVLFDAPLDSPAPLHELWEEAIPYRPHPLQGSRRLRFHEASGLLLRGHKRFDYMTEHEGGLLPMEARVGLVEAHFALLQQAGLSIVRHTTELSHDGTTNGYPVAFSASKFVPEGRKLDSRDARTEISRDKVEQLVIQPLQDYYRWCRETGAKLILSDIYDPHQFSWDTASGTVYLHDIDPKLLEHSTGSTALSIAWDTESMLTEIEECFDGIGR